jgi:hypothetical protein
MTSSAALAWEFGGPLARLDPRWALILLAASAAAGLVAIGWSYARTRVGLSRGRRIGLASVRSLLWIGLCLALAGPVRIERTVSESPARTLAVLVDRSGSMLTPDRRGRRRVDEALRRWFALAPAGRAVRVFAFADRLVELPRPDDETAPLDPNQTRLFGSLDELMQQAPPAGWAGIVTLTDGRDTASADVTAALDATAALAGRADTPLDFIVGRNLESTESPFVACRELTVPDEVPPHAAFTILLTVDAYSRAARTLPTRVQWAGRWHDAAPLFLAAGRHIAIWREPVAVEAPGLLPIEIEIGRGPDRLRLQTSVRVSDPTRLTHVLYFEGALDWSRKFLDRLLRRDAAFDFRSVVHVQSGGAASAGGDSPEVKAIPETAEGFADTDLLVIANASARQFTDRQQQAIAAWVGSGGTLLFLAPDDRATSDYAGTELEKLLPVVFPPRSAAPEASAEVRAYRRKMEWLAHSDPQAESDFAQYAIDANPLAPLAPFAWEPGARDIFMTDGAMPAPLFSSYARVARAKPGARVLARHPSELAPGGDRAILFALQPYGRGQVAALMCDALWRWKLSEPSDRRNVEVFWQQLFAWLGRLRERAAALRFEAAPLTARQGAPLVLRVVGRRLDGLTAQAALADEPPVSLERIPADTGVAAFRWTPARPGLWAIQASNPPEKTTRWVSVQAAIPEPTGEFSGLPPDEATLQVLASRTGGQIVADAAPSAWAAPAAEKKVLVSEQRHRLWDRSFFMIVLLALAAVEWTVRRRSHLL